MAGRSLGWLLLWALTVACSGSARSADSPPPAQPENTENSMSEYRIGENEVATIGRHRVALAKTWREGGDGDGRDVAWLSVVEKGTPGARDLELAEGDDLQLGDHSLTVVEVVVGAEGAGGSVLLKGR